MFVEGLLFLKKMVLLAIHKGKGVLVLAVISLSSSMTLNFHGVDLHRMHISSRLSDLRPGV